MDSTSPLRKEPRLFRTHNSSDLAGIVAPAPVYNPESTAQRRMLQAPAILQAQNSPHVLGETLVQLEEGVFYWGKETFNERHATVRLAYLSLHCSNGLVIVDRNFQLDIYTEFVDLLKGQLSALPAHKQSKVYISTVINPEMYDAFLISLNSKTKRTPLIDRPDVTRILNWIASQLRFYVKSAHNRFMNKIEYLLREEYEA